MQDYLIGNSPPPAVERNVVIIGVGDPALAQFPEPVVLWHKYLAGVVDGARMGGARALGMDLIPALSLNWLDRKLDAALFRALRKAGQAGTPVVLGFDAGSNGMLPLQKFRMAASGLGYLNFWPDRDGVVRSYRNATAGEGEEIPSLALALAKRSPDPLEVAATTHVDYRHPPLPVVSFAELYHRTLKGDEAWLRAHLEGKTLLIGVTTRKLHDHHTAPISSASRGEPWIYGVMIHGLVLETLLSGQSLKSLPAEGVLTLSLGIALCTALLALLLSPVWAATLITLLGGLLLLAVHQAFAAGTLVPAAPLVTALLLPGLITGLYRYVVEYWQFRTLQRYFKSYVSPDVMSDIIEHQGEAVMGGQTVNVTIMFTDIRNFTTLSERMPPTDVVVGLNRYFAAMTHAVIESGGYLNRYLGDGILAIFGAPNALPNDGATAAVEAAFRMRRELQRLNRSPPFPGVDEIRIGIGIHTGEAIVGNIGCAEKMDYSVIGDTVNLASRIESMTKVYDTPILISESTRARIGKDCRVEFVDSVQVKGREQQVELYRVFSNRVSEGEE